MSGSFLERVRGVKEAEVEASLASGVAARDAALPAGVGGRLVGALRGVASSGRAGVIAEIKRSSPSAGAIEARLDAGAQARRYVAGGAAAISVLTEERWFGGSLSDLAEVSASAGCVTLRKDFVLHEAQIDAALAAGAGGVLLIVAFLSADALASLYAYAVRRGLDALVEVHTEAEAEVAASLGAPLIGVNARDLRTLEVDRGAVLRLGPRLEELTRSTEGVILVAESGIQAPAHVRAAWASGYRAVLVGEALVRAADPSALVRGLSEAPRGLGE